MWYIEYKILYNIQYIFWCINAAIYLSAKKVTTIDCCLWLGFKFYPVNLKKICLSSLNLLFK